MFLESLNAGRGYRLPPIEMVQDYQLRLKTSCKKAPIKRTNVTYYDRKATVFATPNPSGKGGIIVAFNESTSDLITGDRQRGNVFNRFRDKNYLVSDKFKLKWSKN